MQILKCKNCGAQLDMTKAVGGVVECEYCHSKHTLAKSTDEGVLNVLAIGEHCLDNGKFDEAFSAYGKAVAIDGDEPEAHFGMALASNRVRYIKDVKNNRLQPICYAAERKNFASDADYLKALSLATPAQKAEYERRAREIDYIRNEFYKLKESGKQYDCFICVKVTGDDGRKTIDSDRANDIYYYLKDKGYRPFYSEREIQNETGADYETRILYALYSSPCMLVICGNENYLQTPWVKNEYMRFISLINDEQKEANSIAIAFFDTPIERLPGRNGRLQGVCLNKPDAYGKITDFVDRCSPSAKLQKEQAEENRKAQEAELKRQLQEQAELQAKQLEEFKRQQVQAQKDLQEKLAAIQAKPQTSPIAVGGNANMQSLLARVNQFLDANDFGSAKIYCDKALDIDPENGEAWMGLLLIQSGAYSPTLLIKKATERLKTTADISAYKESMPYKNAQKYAVQYKETLDALERELTVLYEKLEAAEEEIRRIKEERSKAEEECKMAISNFYTYCETEDLFRERLTRCRQSCVGKIIVPESIKFIGWGAFRDCSGLTSIEIPDSVEGIFNSVFEGCHSLKSITIPNKIRCIDNGAFKDCSSLTSITIPDSVTSIGGQAFSGCSSLTSIIFGKNSKLKSIDYSAFSGCRSLRNIEIPNGVTKIEGGTFSNCSSLTGITIPNSVTSIGKYAYFNCSSLTSIKIPNSITRIDSDAFYGCSSLTSITIPNSVTRIGKNAFCRCEKLVNVTMPKRFKRKQRKIFGEDLEKNIQFTYTK